MARVMLKTQKVLVEIPQNFPYVRFSVFGDIRGHHIRSSSINFSNATL
jgi:hypothetical protein